MTMNNPMLENLADFQRTLMNVLDVPHVEGLPFYLQPAFREAMIGVAQEALETHEAAGAMTKPWKAATEDDVKEELIDVLFYWLEGVVVSGLTFKEIETIYLGKYFKNLERVIASSHADENKKRKAIAAIEEFRGRCVLGESGWEQILTASDHHDVTVISGNK